MCSNLYGFLKVYFVVWSVSLQQVVVPSLPWPYLHDDHGIMQYIWYNYQKIQSLQFWSKSGAYRHSDALLYGIYKLLVYTVYCKLFKVEKFCGWRNKLYSLENIHDCMVILCILHKSIITNSLEKFHVYWSIHENRKTFPPRTIWVLITNKPDRCYKHRGGRAWPRLHVFI